MTKPTYRKMMGSVVFSLGLGLSDVASVVRLSKQDVRKLMAGLPVEGGLARLEAVYPIAKEVLEFNDKSFGRLTQSFLVDGISYLERLTDDDLDQEAIIEHARQITGVIDARNKATRLAYDGLTDLDNLSSFSINKHLI